MPIHRRPVALALPHPESRRPTANLRSRHPLVADALEPSEPEPTAEREDDGRIAMRT
jgi:hypothetical protein